jgi:hypothetical protein
MAGTDKSGSYLILKVVDCPAAVACPQIEILPETALAA